MTNFKFSCPHCNQRLEAPEEMIGQTVDCPVCNGRITIPQPEPATQQPPEESPSHPAPPLPAEQTPLDVPSQSMQTEDGQTNKTVTGSHPLHTRWIILGGSAAVAAVIILVSAWMFWPRGGERHSGGIPVSAGFGQNTSLATADEQQKFNERADTLMKRIGMLPPETGREWINLLKAVSGEDIQGLDVVLFLVKQDNLFPKEQFLKSRSDQLLARMKMVPPDDIKQWHTVLITTSGEEITRAQTVILMIQIDLLFPQERFSSSESDTIIFRLKTVSGDAITKWQKEKGGNLSRSQIALIICMENKK